MAESSKTAKVTLRLLIDKDKNKVVLAESGKDFVDVLFSFLTLPMGTIVRLLEKHRKSSPQAVIGCFNNLYKSVSEMSVESFQTETCKQMLLYPRSVKHDKYRKLKLQIDDTEAVKFFVCPRYHYGEPCKRFYSISNTEECGCGEIGNSKGLMNFEVLGLEKDQVKGGISRNSHTASMEVITTGKYTKFLRPVSTGRKGSRPVEVPGEAGSFDSSRNDNGGIFVSGETSFIISDDLKVVPSSMDYALSTLRGLGYSNANKLGEIFLDVGFSEVLILLECLFTSDSPLTDTFLRKGSSLRMTRSRIPLSPTVQNSGAGPDQTITLKAFSRKLDSKLLCIECGADFIDLLFIFLALPLESVWEISGDNTTLGRIRNLFRSFKSLNQGTDASSSKCLLPSYYSCPKQLLDVVTEQREIYYSFTCGYLGETCDGKFTRKMPDCLVPQEQSTVGNIQSMHLDQARVLYMKSFGFVKKRASFLVTDDLVITPVSNISFLKLKIQLEAEDNEEQVITIGKPEAINLLRASLMTSSPLTSCFWNSIAKKVKEET